MPNVGILRALKSSERAVSMGEGAGCGAGCRREARPHMVAFWPHLTVYGHFTGAKEVGKGRIHGEGTGCGDHMWSGFRLGSCTASHLSENMCG